MKKLLNDVNAKFAIGCFFIGCGLLMMANSLLPKNINFWLLLMYGMGFSAMTLGWRFFYDYRKAHESKAHHDHEHVTLEELAQKRWQMKIDAELKAIAEADDMCRCGHKKKEHTLNPLVQIIGSAGVVAMGMRLDSCTNGYVEGVSEGCDCPAFLRVDANEVH